MFIKNENIVNKSTLQQHRVFTMRALREYIRESRMTANEKVDKFVPTWTWRQIAAPKLFAGEPPPCLTKSSASSQRRSKVQMIDLNWKMGT